MSNKRISRMRLCISVLMFSLLFSCSILNAQEQTESETIKKALDEAEDNLQNSLDSYYRFMPSRSVDGLSGNVKIRNADAKYSYEFKTFDKLPVKFSLDNEFTGIENFTEVELPAHLVRLATDIETTLPLFNFNNTYIRLGVSPSFYSDDWDFPASSFRIPSRYYIIYQPDSKWTYVAGVAFSPEFEYEILPILGFIYKPNDRLTFNIIPERPNISYLLNDRVTLFLEGGSHLSEYEVTKDNLEDVVLEYREIHAGTGIKYKVNEFIRASVSSGVVFNHYLKYRDSLGKVDIKNGIYTEARLEIKI